MEPQLLPTCDLREVEDEVQDEHMLFSTAHTPILFAGNMNSYSQRQEHRMFLLFCTRATSFVVSSTNWLPFMSGKLTVVLLD
jgi:hypothetical protein